MITEIFATNALLICICMFLDIKLDLNLQKTNLNTFLCLWVSITALSIPVYIIYLIWS